MATTTSDASPTSPARRHLLMRVFAAFAFVDFLALNIYALVASGFDGLVTFITTMGPWEMVLAADVVIALTMLIAWMWSNAATTGRNPLGYTIATLLTGSLGPLAYVVLGKRLS